jgi:hypothetical protein
MKGGISVLKRYPSAQDPQSIWGHEGI